MHDLPQPTSRLHLRHFVEADALDVMALNGEPSTRRWLPSHVYATAEEARATVKWLIDSYDNPGDPRLAPYVLAVCETATSRLIGHVGFSPLHGEDDVEVSYAIAESDRGRGYGAESLAQACRWAASTFGVTRLLALTASDNVASRRVLERAGFRHVRDEERVFQGVRQLVSRHGWHAQAATTPDEKPAASPGHRREGLIEQLGRVGGVFRGAGVNHEQEAFSAELRLERLVDGRAVLLRYRATLADGSLAHEECTLLAAGPDGVPCLWPVMSELPVVLPHVQQPAQVTAGRHVFASGPRDDTTVFREEITIELGPGDALTYAHAWGLPDGPFAARSSARLVRVEVAAVEAPPLDPGTR